MAMKAEKLQRHVGKGARGMYFRLFQVSSFGFENSSCRLLVVGLCLEFGAWNLVLGIWCLVFGAWCLVLGVWCLVLGVCFYCYKFLASSLKIINSELIIFSLDS